LKCWITGFFCLNNRKHKKFQKVYYFKNRSKNRWVYFYNLI